MSTRLLEKQSDRLHEQIMATQTNLNDWGKRIATWLVVGNGAALAFCLNAYLTGRELLKEETILNSALCFSLGLILAFASAAIGYLSMLYVNLKLNAISIQLNKIVQNETLIRELENDGIDVPEDNPLRAETADALQELNEFEQSKKIAYIWSGVVIVLIGLSAIAFAVGLIGSIRTA